MENGANSEQQPFSDGFFGQLFATFLSTIPKDDLEQFLHLQGEF